eukprot:11491358-Alexandrium_andersonii.AAC.1
MGSCVVPRALQAVWQCLAVHCVPCSPCQARRSVRLFAVSGCSQCPVVRSVRLFAVSECSQCP